MWNNKKKCERNKEDKTVKMMMQNMEKMEKEGRKKIERCGRRKLCRKIEGKLICI
jgi:hypothetical protein